MIMMMVMEIHAFSRLLLSQFALITMLNCIIITSLSSLPALSLYPVPLPCPLTRMEFFVQCVSLWCSSLGFWLSAGFSWLFLLTHLFLLFHFLATLQTLSAADLVLSLQSPLCTAWTPFSHHKTLNNHNDNNNVN